METTCEALRKREWRARRRANRRQKCGCCQEIFTPSRADQAFCGPACKQRGFRRRRKAGEPASSRPRNAPWLAPEPVRPPNTENRVEAAQRRALRTTSGKIIDVMALIG
jgi:hypothetical protein